MKYPEPTFYINVADMGDGEPFAVSRNEQAAWDAGGCGDEVIGVYTREQMTKYNEGKEFIITQLESVLPEIEFGRSTHVTWRDWLLKDPNNINRNPDCGNAEFHIKCIAEYDARLKAIRDAIVFLRNTNFGANK